jgi:hypothetical protein
MIGHTIRSIAFMNEQRGQGRACPHLGWKIRLAGLQIPAKAELYQPFQPALM